MTARRRQSKAFRSLDDEAFAAYRDLCLPRDLGGKGRTLAAVVAWLAKRGVKSSASMVSRDAEYFGTIERTKQRIARAGAAAREIVQTMQASEAVAASQAASVELYTQMVMDLLIRETEIKLDDLPKWSKLGATLARLTGSQISLYRAEVERRANEAAAKAEALAARSSGDAKAALAKLAKEILGVAA